MSYTGESYNGKKYVHAIASENQFITLDDIVVKVGAGFNSRRINIKSVTNNGNLWGINLVQQDLTIVAPSALGLGLYNSIWTEILPGYWFDLNGSTQKLLIRDNQYANNRGVYQITVVAGVGNNASGFNKFSLLIERL